MSYATFSPSASFSFEIALSSAPSLPFAITDEDDAAISLVDASLWFMVKADDNDADADALISLSTSDGSIVLTDAAGGEGQLEFSTDATEETQALKARPYPAYFKLRLSSGEIRTFGGQVCMTPAGILAT